MSETPASAGPPPSSVAPTSTSAGQSEGRGRGGRGRGRGSFSGGGRGRGGGGGGRGGASSERGGRLRGHMIPQARRSHRHRTRSGKRPRDASVMEDKRFFADGTPVGEDGENEPAAPSGDAQPTQPQKKAAKLNSAFTVLRNSLTDAASIAEYIRVNNQAKPFKESKTVNMFLQAISNRPDALYAELMGSFKSEVAVALERIYSLFSLGKVAMTPSAHEFVIRCEQQGVRSAEWYEGVQPLEGLEPSLFTPRELIKRLGALNPVTRLHRQIELSSSIADVTTCARKMDSLLSAAEQDADTDEEVQLDYAKKCQTISKLISKARRLVTVPSAPKPAKAADADGTTAAEVEEGAAPQDEAVEESSAPQQLIQLSAEEKEHFQDMVGQVLKTLQRVLTTRPAGTTQQPIAKLVHFAAWCSANGLVRPEDRALVQSMEETSNDDMVQQASQLEAVMRLKEIPSGDVDALLVVVEEMWKAGNETHLFPCSADVLSAIGTAASADAVSDETKKLLASRLVDTQLYHTDGSVQLPRRALRFVNAVRAKEKQQEMQRIQEEAMRAAPPPKPQGEEEEDEEEGLGELVDLDDESD